MKVHRDITASVRFGNPDDELMPLDKCACGHTFKHWEFTLSIYEDDPRACPKCGRKMYFSQTVHVYEVE